MRKKYKKKILLLLFLLSISIIQSQTFNDGVLEYAVTDVTNSYVSIKKYNNVCPFGELIIPSSVTSIGHWAFSGCYGLTSVTVNWTTPLVVGPTIFDGVDINTIPLTVPIGTVTAYQSAVVWQDFGSVVWYVEDFLENDLNVQIYPNPVHDQLHIDLSSDLVIEGVNIYTNLGQLVKQEVSSRIDVSNLKGVYFVQITTNKGKITKKIIVE